MQPSPIAGDLLDIVVDRVDQRADVTDHDARRLIILFVEDQLQKQQAKASGGTPPISA